MILGCISFPLYLVHFIVLCSLASNLYIALPPSLPVLAGIFAAYLAVAILLAHAFEALIDRPAIALSHRFSKWLFRFWPRLARVGHHDRVDPR